MPELSQKPQRNIKRQVAVKVSANELINGNYIKEEGWLPNYIQLVDGKKVSRVNIIGIVVFKSNEENVNYQNTIIDDGSGKISLRSFEGDYFKNINVGDIILVIGRPREFNKEIYLIPEILKKMQNHSWMKVRKIELNYRINNNFKNEASINKKKELSPSPNKIPEDNSTHKPDVIYELIKKLDSGEGIPTDDIIKKSNIHDAEKFINKLLENGDVFELKPGVLKVLE